MRTFVRTNASAQTQTSVRTNASAQMRTFAQFLPSFVRPSTVTGLKDKVRRPKMNLTLLRQNKRRIKQKAGRKHPRPGDYDVSSAPDAIEKLRASPNRKEMPGQLPETKETDWFENDSDTDFISSIANTESGSTTQAHSKKRTSQTKAGKAIKYQK